MLLYRLVKPMRRFFLPFEKMLDNPNATWYSMTKLVSYLSNKHAKVVRTLNINPNSEKPIFIQIAEQLEDSIFTGVFPEESRIPSTNEISALFNINPHTVLKGMNMLVDEEIIYKKRGLGMYVKEGAVGKIRKKRQEQFYDQYIAALVEEASKLQMSKEEVMELIERGYEHERGEHS